VHHLAFSNSSDLFLGVVILYNVGVQIERQFGSVKFAVSTIGFLGFQAWLIFIQIVFCVGVDHGFDSA
jgi:hypothetical protein